MIGHNHPTFDDVVKDNLRGLLIAIKETIITAIHDPRLQRRHLRVLALVVDHLNSSNGMAYPGRKKLAADSAALGWQAFTEMTVATTIKELIRWGYLIADQRGPSHGGRAIAHYTIRRPSVEDLQAEITAWVRMQTQDRTKDEPWKKRSGEDNGVHARADGEDPSIHTRTDGGENVVPTIGEDPVLPASSGGDPVVPSGGDPVLPTVTRRGTRRENTHDLFGTDAEPETGSDQAQSVKTTPEFDAFWDAYPKREGKVRAFATFSKIVKGEHKDIERVSAGAIIRGARGFAQYVDREKTERQYIPNPQTWLNRGGWEDESARLEEDEPRRWWQNPEKVAKCTLEDWARGIEKYCGEFWDQVHLGPPPGEIGCVVPEFFVHKLGLREMFDHRGLRRK